MTTYTLHQLRATRDALREKLAEVERITPTCVHCRHCTTAMRCDLFDGVPPEDFRATPEACESWEWDGIPF